MGVPRLFPWLIKAFPKAHFHYIPPSDGNKGKIAKVDALYLDANGLLHSAAQVVFNYGEGKRLMDPNAKLSYDEKIKKVYTTFFDMISKVVSIIDPETILYIAIDGPAPLAKQAQQRQRRFASALLATGKGMDWEPTNITPGTTFMFELTKYLHYAIRNKVNLERTKGGWGHLEVLFSPCTVPGEGEHKIMDYMRALPGAREMSHCMFGPDGDLIMLTLAAHLPKMYLFRSDQYNPGQYDLLDMGMIREYLPNKLFKGTIEKPIDDIINDFIILGFFVGNDFLPKLQMFTYLEDGLELVLRLYSSMGTSILTKDGKLELDGSFASIVDDMARREGQYIYDQSKIKHADPRFADKTLMRNIKGGNNWMASFDFQSYRRDYYAKAHIEEVGDPWEPSAEVRRLCLEYLHSINWVFIYYVIGIPSWSHFYERHYAPLMGDLSSVIKSLSEEERNYIYSFDFGKPSLPFVQLLSIIAPKNVKLLPEQFHDLMLSPESELVSNGYYPDTFEIDYEGKTKEHMGVALLPFIDVEVVRKNYEMVASETHKKYVRNSIGRLEKFVRDHRYTATYVSDYGTIKGMHVRKL